MNHLYPQGSHCYTEREDAKNSARADKRNFGDFTSLGKFEKVASEWWHRVHAKVSFQNYCQHLVRAQLLAGNDVPPDIIAKYPPAKGKVKIAPGGSDYHPRGIHLEQM